MSLRMHTIMRILARSGVLSIYQLRKKLELELGKKVGYGRVYEYVRRLEKSRAVRLVGRGSRHAALYELDGKMIGPLYFQHFLTSEEILGFVLKNSTLGPLLRELEMPSSEISRVVQTHLSASILEFLAGRHFRDRAFNTTPVYYEKVEHHLEHTRFRDLKFALFELILERLEKEPEQIEIVREAISKSQELKVIAVMARKGLKEFEVSLRRIRQQGEILNQLTNGARLSTVLKEISPKSTRRELV